MHYQMPPDQHARIFGPKDDLDSNGPGRSRICKSCGGWHRLDRPWPHNCRKEQPRRSDYPSPQITPSFEAFKTSVKDGAVITNRYEKAEFMKRHDLVEYDEGVAGQRTPDWIEERRNKDDIVADLNRFHETDPENLPPDLKAQRMNEGGSLEDGTEISTDGIEVIE